MSSDIAKEILNMPGICCNVQSCAHNRSGRCCIDHVNVLGNHATDCAYTCCASYIDKASGIKAENSCCRTNVDCSAENCIHNYKGDCAAERITVSGKYAHQCDDTQCSSFDCKY